jgi:hypothetical protein
MGKVIKGKKFSATPENKNFQNCVAGHPIIISLILFLLIHIISICLGVIYGVSVIQILAGLIEDQLSILIVFFGIAVCILITSVVFIVLAIGYSIVNITALLGLRG